MAAESSERGDGSVGRMDVAGGELPFLAPWRLGGFPSGAGMGENVRVLFVVAC